jgi:hypothetical protein
MQEQTNDRKRAQIITPAANIAADVQQWYPGFDEGVLCCCDGTATPPNPNYIVYLATLLLRRAGDPPPTVDELYSSWHTVYPSPPNGNWTYDGMLTAFINEASDPPEKHNKLYLGAFSIDYTNPQPLPPETDDVVFPGNGVPTCPSCTRDEAAQRAELPMDVPPPLCVDACPVGASDGWLEYRHLAVDSLVQGNRLMLNGKPLRGSALAVSASNVAWYHGLRNPRLVRRPLGHITAASAGWFFQQSPEAALIVWQGNRTRRHVLASESQDRPDIVDLDPDKDVYVQVNFHRLDAFARKGGFDLWVKPIT